MYYIVNSNRTGISSCQCRPGYAKRNHRDPCRKVVAMVFSMRVDKMYGRKVCIKYHSIFF